VSVLSDLLCDRSRGSPFFSVDGVVPASDGLAVQLTVVEAMLTVDDDVCGVGFMTICEVTEFSVPINELLHTFDRTSA
jgi:hypothetical protein